uniref:Putative lipid-transfer protein 1 n=1 Tax=Nepenthes mirabilis TaxID=150983 RepID=A0A140GMM8_NEPMI|nr:putative lipid-transfer protein 1 [Nepenthes mirabilis]
MALKISLLVLALLGLWVSESGNVADAAHRGTAAPAADCSNLVLNMADCLSFVQNGSTATKPEESCCSGLKTVLKTDAECLCEAFKSSSQFGVVLNVTKALSLPSACHVKTPSFSTCGLSPTSPTGAPVVAPKSGPSLSIANAPSEVMAGNEVAPAPAPGKSSSSLPGISMGSVIAALIAVVFSYY